MIRCSMLYNDMIRQGFVLNSSIWHSLILGYCKSGSLAVAVNFLRKMTLECFIADCFAFNMLITKFCERDEIKIAFDPVKLIIC